MVNNVSFSLFSEIYMVKLFGFCVFCSFLIDRKRTETHRFSDQWSKAACLHMYKILKMVYTSNSSTCHFHDALDMFVAS